MSHILRDEHKCDFIVALTHMRQPDDERLAVEAKDVDLILAGHDHSVSVMQVNGAVHCQVRHRFQDVLE